jgi:hypothetical protein
MSKVEFLGFINSFLNIKKSFVLPSKDDVSKGVIKTFKELTSEDRKIPAPIKYKEVSWADSEGKGLGVSFDVSELTVESEIRRTVKEIFKNRKYELADRIRPFVPSFKANYVRTRSEYGTFMEIAMSEWFIEWRTANIEKIHKAFAGLTPSAAELPQAMFEMYRKVDLGPFEEVFESFYYALCSAAALEVFDHRAMGVTLVGLAEPLKVRVISKGPPLVYAMLKPLQRFLWSTLKSHRVFQLIGAPIRPDIIQDVLRIKTGEWLLSGDYSQATNLIFSKWSEVVVDEISTVLDLAIVEREAFKLALTGHIVEWEKDGVTQESLPQKKGQLMGSIVSFPVLCILNATACRWAIELDSGKRVALREVRLLVNGDDCVFVGSAGLLAAWRALIGFFGFEESVGKCYFAQDFLIMNSEAFALATSYQVSFRTRHDRYKRFELTEEEYKKYHHFLFTVKYGEREDVEEYPLDEMKEYKFLEDMIEWDMEYERRKKEGFSRVVRKLEWTRGRAINLGLVMGRSDWSDQEAKLGDVLFQYDSFGSRCCALVDLAPWRYRDMLIRYFIKNNSEFLQGPLLKQLPWFIPTSFGGLGLPCGSEPDIQPSSLDLRIAKSIKHFGGVRTVALPAEIQLESIVSGRTGKLTYRQDPDPNFDRWKSSLYCSVLFSLEIDKVVLASEGRSAERKRLESCVKNNARLWSRTLRKGVFFHGKLSMIQMQTLYPVWEKQLLLDVDVDALPSFPKNEFFFGLGNFRKLEKVEREGKFYYQLVDTELTETSDIRSLSSAFKLTL